MERRGRTVENHVKVQNKTGLKKFANYSGNHTGGGGHIGHWLINPNKENNWNIKINNIITCDEKKIANAFNTHFEEKISKLKEGINKDDVTDPLIKKKKTFIMRITS